MKRYVWGILIGFFIFFSMSPTVYELAQKEKIQGRTFELVHNYITDYNFYLSRIREGMEGRWTVVERYTSEPHRGSLVQIFYLLLGKPVQFFSDRVWGATYAYHGARIIFGAIVLFLLSLVVRRVFRSFLWQVLAFLMVVTASTVPIVVPMGETIRFGGYMSWWTVMDSLQRITFLPHLLLGQAGILLLLCVPFEQIFLKFISAFILGMVFPPGALFVAVVLTSMSIVEVLFAPHHFLKSGKDRILWFQTNLFPRIAVVIGCIPALFYYSLIMTQSPWRRLVEFDALNPTVFPLLEYGYAMGPVLLFGTLGGVLSLFKKEKNMLIFVSWVITWAIFLLVFRFVPQQSSLRFTEMIPNVPLGILTTYLFYQCGLFSRRLFAKNMKYPSFAKASADGQVSSIKYQVWKIGKTLSYIILYTLCFIPIAVGFLVMVSSFLWQKDFIDQKVRAGWPAISMNNYIVYPMAGFIDALNYIESHTEKEAVILSDLTAGNYIPAYAGRTVYVGHDNTLDKEIKVDLAHQFFLGEMTPSDAEVWLMQNRITHVFFGPQEKESKKDIASLYPFLREVYRNTDVTLYSVFPATPN